MCTTSAVVNSRTGLNERVLLSHFFISTEYKSTVRSFLCDCARGVRRVIYVICIPTFERAGLKVMTPLIFIFITDNNVDTLSELYPQMFNS